ncbi:MAG: hypothetical protein BEN19_05780 [Epulopiscium sp. Nuni2H_MBin003]|nr:MAG: hypothetical protein BEN19_05780 [Epulopiscium sp. Nuni2H_MBin003]
MNLIDGMSLINSLLLIAGFILIGVEIIMPGISVSGIAGSVCILISIFLIADNIAEGVAITIIVIIILAIMFYVAVKVLSTGKLYSKIVLTDKPHKLSTIEELEVLVDKDGIALTDLRPTGFILVDNKKVEVVSNSRFIMKNEKVVISHLNGKNIVVSPIKED